MPRTTRARAPRRAPTEWRYSACGLTIAADAAIAGLPAAPGSDPADLTVAFHADQPLPAVEASDQTWYASPECDAAGLPVLAALRRPGDGSRWLRYSEGAAFRLDGAADRVDAWWQPPLTDADAATYLLGPVLAFAMRMRGLVPLHASGVAIDGRAVLFAGTPGAGKSTTAAAFASLGVPVLSDDVVPIVISGTGPRAWPGYPRLSLWADAADAVFGTSSPLAPFSATYAKRYLDLEPRQLPFQRTPLPIGAVYVLDGLESPMAPLPPREAVVALLAHTYGTYLIDSGLRAREFDVLAQLAAAVPVWRLRWGTDLGDLTRRCVVLADHVRHTIYRDASHFA